MKNLYWKTEHGKILFGIYLISLITASYGLAYKKLTDVFLFMKSRDARNLIITLVVIAVGIKLITYISGRYIGQAGAVADLVASFTGLGDLVLYGVIILAVILVPVYLSKRSQEKAR